MIQLPFQQSVKLVFHNPLCAVVSQVLSISRQVALRLSWDRSGPEISAATNPH